MSLRSSRLRALALTALGTLSGCSGSVDSPSPTVTALSRRLACSEQLTTPIEIAGTGFTPLPARTLTGAATLILPQIALTAVADPTGSALERPAVVVNPPPEQPGPGRVRWESSQLITFDLDPSLALVPALYDLSVTNPGGQSAGLTRALGLVPRPQISSPSPLVACAQADAPLVIEGRGFVLFGDVAPTVELRSGATTASTLATEAQACTPSFGGQVLAVRLCTRLSAVLPRGALAPGSYTLVVTNPAPASCVSTEPVELQVSATPGACP